MQPKCLHALGYSWYLCSVNKGNIYKFFLKPWNDDTLKLEIKKALDHYDLIKKNRELSQIIKEQNEELKAANDNLEKKVSDRTRELELKNQALELSRVILHQLPFPVLGIDNEGYIAMANQYAMELPFEPVKLNIGFQLKDFFNAEIEDKAIAAINESSPVVIDPFQIGDNTYIVELRPFSGRFEHKGGILPL